MTMHKTPKAITQIIIAVLLTPLMLFTFYGRANAQGIMSPEN